MASISIAAALHSACSSHHFTKKQTKPARSLGSKQLTQVVTINNVEEQKKGASISEKQDNSPSHTQEFITDIPDDEKSETQSSTLKFIDERWKKGTWDLNMFVKDGNMDWDDLIEAEAKRRKFLEMYPEASTNEEPVVFRSSIIPWWAWLKKSYLPEAELLNGRAAMMGFFMSYIVDAMTGLDMVGQTGNFICKAGVFVTVASIILFRRTNDFQNLRNLADEATLYDKQWQASWQDQNAIPKKPEK